MTEDRKHHSTVQPRAQGGQWRQPAGPFDHAGKVPAGAPRYGEPVLNRMVQADAADDVSRALALPQHMVKP